MTKPTLIVATDFTARADRAIDRALQLGRDSKLPIRFIHAIDPARSDAPSHSELARRMEQCVGYPAGTDLGGGPMAYAFPEGAPLLAIAAACEAQDDCLLLIGPARYNSLGDFLMGTAVDYVLRHTTKPVLIVKRRVREAYDAIVVGTDFSPASAQSIIAAARLFPQAQIHVTHAWHVPFDAFQRDGYVAEETEAGEAARLSEFMQALAAREPRLAEATTALVRGGAFDAVKHGLKQHPDALVALGSHGATGFREATLGSNTADMLRFLDADILVVNTKGA